MAYMGSLLLKEVPVSDFRSMKGKGFHQLKYMRWFISFRSVKRHKRAISHVYFMVVEKSRKRSGFVIFSCLKDSAFTAVKRD